NIISGSSSVMQFDAWNWEDAAVKVDDGIHLHWPSTFRRGRWWEGETGFQANKEYTKEIDKIVVFLANSEAYGKDAAKEQNQAFAAMQGLFNGAQKLYVYADGEREIIDAVTTAKANGVQHVVLV